MQRRSSHWLLGLYAVTLAAAAHAADAPVAPESAPPQLEALVSCLAGASTAAERDAALQLWFHDSVAANPDARRLAVLAPEAREALVRDLARGIGRIAATTCTREIRALGATEPAPLVGALALLLGQLGTPAAGAPARIQALGTELGRQIDPAVLARITVPGPVSSPGRPIAPAPGGRAADPDGSIPAAIDGGQDLGALCPYPRTSRRLGQSGTVVLLLDVDADGYVEDVAIDERSPHALLDYAAASCIANVRFQPRIVDGKRVSSRQRIRWTWRLED